MSNQETSISFYNGKKMPIIGLGTWHSPPDVLKAALNTALELGYRHIDTASFYNNEAAIGETLKEWFDSGRLKREDVFVVTKLSPTGNRAEYVEKHLTKSLKALQLDYLDLYLFSIAVGLKDMGDGVWPVDEKGEFITDDPITDIVSVWKALEAQVDAGRIRSIGLSNFNSKQVARIVKAARIRPANIQLELNVYIQQRELVAFCRALDITVCAYCPIGSPGAPKFFESRGMTLTDSMKAVPMENPVVCQIAKKHNKTPAQVLLRHIIQRGIAVIPGSTNSGRVKENFQIFDFELSEEEVAELNALDRGKKGRKFFFAFQKRILEHPEYPYHEPY